MNYSVSNVEELRRLIASPKTTHGWVSLNLPFMNAHANRIYGERINAYRHACGCSAGGWFLVVSAVLCIICCIFRVSVFATDWVKQIAIASAIVFLSAMVGKGVGLIYSKMRLRLTVSAIEKAQEQGEVRIKGPGVTSSSERPIRAEDVQAGRRALRQAKPGKGRNMQ